MIADTLLLTKCVKRENFEKGQIWVICKAGAAGGLRPEIGCAALQRGGIVHSKEALDILWVK